MIESILNVVKVILTSILSIISLKSKEISTVLDIAEEKRVFFGLKKFK